MLPRAIFTLSVLLSVATFDAAIASEPAFAQTVEPAVVSSPTNNDVSVPPADSVSQPAVSVGTPAVQPKINLDGSANSLRELDRLMSTGKFALPKINFDDPNYRIALDLKDRSPNMRLDLSARNTSTFNDGGYVPYDQDRMRYEARRELNARTQSTVDRIGDMIAPGFGRMEFEIGSQRARLDYIYSRRCKMKGLGICFQMQFK